MEPNETVCGHCIRQEEATGNYATFEIVRGENLQEEIFEWLSYAVNVLQSMDTKLDQTLDKQDQTLQVARETKEEIAGLRSDTRKHLDDDLWMMIQKIS